MLNKQIEELKAILNRPCEEITGKLFFHGIECPLSCECDECTATNIYNAGFRKQEDVAREIFAEIEMQLNEFDGSWANTVINTQYLIDELKKKYGVTEE